jgi:hypothetical protein
MKIFVFKNTMSIRELGLLTEGRLDIEFVGLNEGERITLRASNGKYAVGALSAGKVSFQGDFLTEGETYTVWAGNNYVFFTYANGAFYHVYDGVTQELTKMWAVIADLAVDLKKVDEKISKFTDGFITE